MTTGTDSQTVLDDNPLYLALAAIAQVAGTIIGGPGAASAGTLEVLRQAGMAEVRPTLLSIAEVMEAYRRGKLTDAEWENVLSRSGYSERASALFRSMMPQLIGVGELVQLRLRGQLTLEDYMQRMEHLGYERANAAELYTLADYVPQPQDVIRFAVREVYSPAIAERFGQFQDFPENAVEDAARAGVSRETLTKYWAAHWELPSITMALDMYHRRAETGVTLDDVRLLLRSQDVMPYWREPIINLATHTYTRVDIRRMHKLGILTDDQVRAEYVALGYSDERAEALTRFVVDLNGAEDDAAIEPFRAGLRSRAVTMYQRAAMSESALRSILGDLGYSPDQVGAFIGEADFIRQADASESVLQQLQKLYVQGHWSLERVVQRMTEFGYTAEEVTELVPAWDLQRELREATQADNAERDLTRADVVGAYTDGLLPLTDAEKHLGDLGYDPDEVNVIIGRADIAKAKSARSELEGTLHTLFGAKRISEAETRSRLAEAGLPPERVDMLVGRWSAEHQAKTPTLTVAQVQRAYARDLIDADNAADRLREHGYNAEDVQLLLQLASPAATDGG